MSNIRFCNCSDAMECDILGDRGQFVYKKINRNMTSISLTLFEIGGPSCRRLIVNDKLIFIIVIGQQECKVCKNVCPLFQQNVT